MTDTDRPATVVEWIDLHQLDPPETDVRQHRDRSQVRSIAQSMENSGQLQAAKVYPSNYDDLGLGDDVDEEALRDAIAEASTFVVVDGWTRREAARINNWDQLRCEIFPTEPDDQVVASLEANTERLEMRDYETFKALHDWKEAKGLTDEEVAERVGKSRSTVSNWFRALEAPEPILQVWKDPDTIIEYGHVREVLRCPTEELMEKCIRDALEFERGVGAFRETVKNTVKGWKRKQRDDRNQEEKIQDGTEAKAEREAARAQAEMEDTEPCLLCGAEAERTIALTVCKEDYGLMVRKRETGEPLMAAPEEPAEEAEADD